jgi:hypothetical protein
MQLLLCQHLLHTTAQESEWTAAVSEAQFVQVQQLQLQVKLLKANRAWALADWQNAKVVSRPGFRLLRAVWHVPLP